MGILPAMMAKLIGKGKNKNAISTEEKEPGKEPESSS